jgi:hypothetical protein
VEREIKRALKGQYHAGLAMLRQAVEKCPEDLWLAGTHPRNTWRIAYHALYYTHLYLQTREEAFVPWAKHREHVPALWDDELESPPVVPPYSKADILEYLELVDAGVDGWVEALDLASQDPGFWWYKIPKLDHQILNVRHLGGHVGQIWELVFSRGIDLDWVTSA